MKTRHVVGFLRDMDPKGTQTVTVRVLNEQNEVEERSIYMIEAFPGRLVIHSGRRVSKKRR